jgi:hypothetical protein
MPRGGREINHPFPDVRPIITAGEDMTIKRRKNIFNR